MNTAVVRRNNPLLINESPMQFLPSLACAVGVNEALFAQQLHYWLQDTRRPHWIDGRPWVYNTFEEWNLQFPFWSRATVRRVIKNLKSVTVNGEVYHVLLTGHYTSNKLDHCSWYTLDYDELDRLVPVATLLLQKKQRDIADTSISIRKNLTVLARQFPALASASEEAKNDADTSRSAQNEPNDVLKMSQTMCSDRAERCAQIEQNGNSASKKPETLVKSDVLKMSQTICSNRAKRSAQNEPNDVLKMSRTMCSNRAKRSAQNEPNDVLKMSRTMCSNRAKRSAQNEIPTNITIDYTIDYSNRLTNKRDTTTTTTACAREADQELAKVVKAYEDNISPMSPMEHDMLIDLYGKYKSEWLLAAIKEAVCSTSGRPSIKYISAILDRWQQDGFQSQKGKGVHDARIRTNRQHLRDSATTAKEQSESEAQFERDVRAWEQQPAPFDLPGDVGL